MRASAVYYGAGMTDAHRIQVEGPIAYPGGKDGSFQASCIAGDWTSDFGTEAEVRSAGTQHAEAKNALERVVARIDVDTVHRLTLRIAVELTVARVEPAERVLACLNTIRRDVGLEHLDQEMLTPLRGL